MTLNREELAVRAKKIKLLIMDCDGVLTDGKLYFSLAGEELKVFNVKDGQGIVSWHKAGYQSGIISGRNSPIVEKRAAELGIRFVRQDSHDKIKCFTEIIKQENILPEETAFIGDDIGDLDLLKLVGFPVTVADSVKELSSIVVYKTTATGGNGAVRELTDLLLEFKN